MSLSIKEIEELHNRGLMPDWYYYQVNGKDINENYREIQRKRQEEQLLEKELENIVDKKVEEVLNSLFIS